MTETQSYQSRVERAVTRLWVPHGRGEIAFAHPSVGPDNYGNVGKTILENGQLVSTGDHTASLLHAAYLGSGKDEPEFEKVREIMKDRWLWVFNRNLWAENGVYALNDLEATGRNQPLDINELERMLKDGKEVGGIRFSQDEKLRFAPKGSYELGEHTSESLAKDGFIIAGYGLEGAEKLGEVSSTFRYKPKTFGIQVNEGQAPEQRVSVVGGSDGGLVVFGYGWYGGYGGHAFGVLK